jgi:hypothetical protein
MKYFFGWIGILFLYVLWNGPVFADALYKDIEISGLRIFRIYNEEFLVNRFKLNRLKRGGDHFKRIAKEINAFYHRRGYILANTYLIEESDSILRIHIDEGRLGKIIIRRLNSIDTLKIKYDFKLKYKVYNKYAVERELGRLKKKYGFKDIFAHIKIVRKYDGSLFQLDRRFRIPLVGPLSLPLILRYGQRYDLEIFIVKKESEDTSDYSYGFRTSYTKGIIPYIEYWYPSLITKGDRFEIGSSVGIFYGFDLEFDSPPRWTFMEVNSKYNFTPTFDDLFTPLVKGSIYRSKTSRKDIGLSQYEYLALRGTLLPGITILKKLRVSAGYGGERVFIYNSKEDPDADYSVDIDEHTDYWNFFEFETELDLIPWTLKRTIKRKLETSYIYYTNNRSFHEFFIRGIMDFEFKNFDIFNFSFEYAYIWRNPPFYHEQSVSSSRFKGFMGKDYHTRKVLKISNEYSISLYRDFLLGGLFTDLTWFEGSGYDLLGDQYGIVYGISCHIIFLDQFEFNIYYGKDYLYSTGESQYNITLNMFKKW